MTEPQPEMVTRRPRFRDPGTAAFIALPLAVWSLSGIDTVWNISQLLYYSDLLSRSSDGNDEWYPVVSMVLSMVFAFGVLVFARSGLARAEQEDPWWVHAMLRASVGLSAVTVLLRVVAVTALLVAAHFR